MSQKQDSSITAHETQIVYFVSVDQTVTVGRAREESTDGPTMVNKQDILPHCVSAALRLSGQLLIPEVCVCACVGHMRSCLFSPFRQFNVTIDEQSSIVCSVTYKVSR